MMTVNHTNFEAMKWIRAFVSSATEGSFALGASEPVTRCLLTTAADIDCICIRPLSSVVTIDGLASWLSSSVDEVSSQ